MVFSRGAGGGVRAASGLRLDDRKHGVAPGQAAVFYAPEGERVLGGGWIAGTA